jgi:hypothetical protein
MGAITFTNRLPDPNWTIHTTGAGHASSYTAGPGFKSIKLSSNMPIQTSHTNSGRLITRQIAGHKWGINITYNPMTRDQFEPVYSFLLQRKGRLNPFYVVLPNQKESRNSDFVTWLAANTNRAIAVDGALNAGVEVMKQDGYSTTPAIQPQPGDMFTITDSSDSLHTKIYRVTRITNEDNYLSGSVPADVERYIYFTPNLQRATSNDSTINYTNPQIRVILKNDVQEFSLGTNNLYTFSLSLEEAQA